MSLDVDLVVCAYRDSPYLRRCLESLAPQVGPGVRLSVATSTPSDFIAAAAREVGARCLVNPRRAGIAGDWNFAFASANAPLVTLCHQDDEYAPDYARTMATTFDASSRVLFAACDHAELDERGLRPLSSVVKVKRLLVRRAFAGAELRATPGIRRRLLSWGNPLSCPGVMIHKALVPDFRFDETFSSNMDWDAWERLARLEGAVAYVDRPLVAHRVHEGSATTALIADSTRPGEDLAMFRRFWPAPVARLMFGLYRRSYESNKPRRR